MAGIAVLDRSVSELIAAGEVIERPSSVIKELAENAIDAGARHITIEIKNGGMSFMRVSDDGCGMAAEDVPTAFLRHATSKVSQKADLDHIGTLGFRGEALASVAAVAKVSVLTKRREDTFGTEYSLAGPERGALRECGCPDGTTMVVRELFFNVPARRKFMKRDTAEGNAVSHIVRKIAVSHPEIAFRFLRDNRVDFCTDGSGELLSAIHSVFGADFARDLLPVNYEEDGIAVSGYTIKPLYARGSRSFQNFFVNTRYVRSRACAAALENAYDNLIMTGKYPACVLFLSMEPGMLDVNIHPAKAEVRFSDEKRVTNALYFAIKNAQLSAGLIYEFQMPKKDWRAGAREPAYEQPEITPPQPSSPPEAAFSAPEKKMFHVEPLENAGASALDLKISDSGISDSGVLDSGNSETKKEFHGEPLENAALDLKNSGSGAENFAAENETEKSERANPSKIAPKVENTEDFSEKTPLFSDIRVIGELFSTYILAQAEDTFLIIDKHAAHERVIFERLRRENCSPYRQMLLTPCRVLLTMEEVSAMEENTDLLERMGFTFDFSEKPYVIARAAPGFFEQADLDDIVQEIARNLRLGKVNPQSRELDNLFHELACKSAIRSGDRSDPAELQALTQRVCGDPAIRHCPHGRPILFTMSRYELEKQFRRRV